MNHASERSFDEADHDRQCPDPGALSERIDRLVNVERPRYRRLWSYYRNPMRLCADLGGDESDSSSRPYRQAQEWGLPSRITGALPGGDPACLRACDLGTRKEVVIENDIAWRVDTMVDFLFGKPLVITSSAPDASRRETIGQLLRLILAESGGILFLQQLALMGAIYGFVDVLVKLDPACAQPPRACSTQDLGQPPESRPNRSGGDADRAAVDETAGPASGLDEGCPSCSSKENPGASHPSLEASPLARLARMVRLEVVEPARALPFLSMQDWRLLVAYGQCIDVPRTASAGRNGAPLPRMSWFERLRRATGRANGMQISAMRASDTDSFKRLIEIITPAAWRRYEDGKLVGQGINSLGALPLVHIQNTAVPFEYPGASEVEPLIPLQDELNTRLSDRAHRITMQSFKMYLGKGVEDFNSLPVAPGRMWMTDNESADVREFGGDAACPSEEAHIAELREAIDKTSGVSPIAAGAIKGRIGRLTSAAALRVTMQALLARTEKKRTTYGGGIARLCELALAWLDRAGLFQTTPEERRIEINWPSPLPANELEKLQEAQVKSNLGVPHDIILRELGY